MSESVTKSASSYGGFFYFLIKQAHKPIEIILNFTKVTAPFLDMILKLKKKYKNKMNTPQKRARGLGVQPVGDPIQNPTTPCWV